MACCTAWHSHTRRSNMKISECFSVNLKTVQRIWKELDEFNCEKRTPRSIGKLQAMIDNYPSETWDCLSFRQVVHEDILYFSYNFYHNLWWTRGKTVLQNFWTNSSIPRTQWFSNFFLPPPSAPPLFQRMPEWREC